MMELFPSPLDTLSSISGKLWNRRGRFVYRIHKQARDLASACVPVILEKDAACNIYPQWMLHRTQSNIMSSSHLNLPSQAVVEPSFNSAA
ncbi:10546_t:CDS:2 [Acaulospora colombiana]|uniref:10546_t:CDS:1 n=1 Tax=Acaulospora colombiana TaxID=27376 RepID=A0ACA9KW60_9GLOM|nr:10546_t:CDS:2 [Acaulospora colombiana]